MLSAIGEMLHVWPHDGHANQRSVLGLFSFVSVGASKWHCGHRKAIEGSGFSKSRVVSVMVYH